jgi:predicted metalloprotease with PDZ domain
MDLEFKVGPTGLKVSNQSHWPTVVAVDPGSRAEQLGVKVGWRVVKVAQDGFSEDWRNSCSQRSCFVGLQYGEPWFADQTLLVRFGLDDQHGYDEVRMGSTQLKKVSNPDAPAFWGTDDD